MNRKTLLRTCLLILAMGFADQVSSSPFREPDHIQLQRADEGEVIFEISGTFKINNPLSQSLIELIIQDQQLTRFKTDESSTENNRVFLAFKFSSRQAYQTWYESKSTKEILKNLKKELNSNIFYNLSVED